MSITPLCVEVYKTDTTVLKLKTFLIRIRREMNTAHNEHHEQINHSKNRF